MKKHRVIIISNGAQDAYETVECRYHFNRFWEAHSTLLPKSSVTRRMIFGHSHRQRIQSFGDDALWLDPGSASYRRPDDPCKDAFYCVIQDGVISLRHTPYNRAPLLDEAERVRSSLCEPEWRVAHFFFGKSEADGPDMPMPF